MILLRSRNLRTKSLTTLRRTLSTLSTNRHIYSFPTNPPGTHLLTYLPTQPPTPSLAIGTTTALPPTPSSLTENPHFLSILGAVVTEHAASDPEVQAHAKAFAATAGAGSGTLFSQKRRQRAGKLSGNTGAGEQGGAGKGGWVHVSDGRNPPDWGRSAWVEDILGSLEVDGQGEVVPGGGFVWGGTYRVVTREGILGLSPFLREKLVEKLRELERAM